MELSQKIQLILCHQVASLAFRFYKIQFLIPLWELKTILQNPLSTKERILPPHSQPPRRLRRLTVDAWGSMPLAPKNWHWRCPSKPNFWIRPWFTRPDHAHFKDILLSMSYGLLR